MQSKTIMVTGGTGFVGSYLRRPDSSMALVGEVADRVRWFTADLLDVPALEAAMEGVRQVYHCAAVVSFQRKEAQRMIRTNREGTANLVNVALWRGVEKLLHVSSISALGRRPDSPMVDETVPWQDGTWNSPYGISKHLSELEVWRGMAEGLPASIVHPSNILGSGFWKDRTSTGQMFHTVWKGLPFRPTGGSGFVDVRDVVRLCETLMNSGQVGERYILNAENLPFAAVFDRMADALGVRRPYIRITPLLREISWRVAEGAALLTGRPPFITRETARMSSRTFLYDNRKSIEAFDFTYIPVERTIRETAAQFLASRTEGFAPSTLPFHDPA
jgi:dihydroflavonol-4-reductase